MLLKIADDLHANPEEIQYIVEVMSADGRDKMTFVYMKGGYEPIRIVKPIADVIKKMEEKVYVRV